MSEERRQPQGFDRLFAFSRSDLDCLIDASLNREQQSHLVRPTLFPSIDLVNYHAGIQLMFRMSSVLLTSI